MVHGQVGTVRFLSPSPTHCQGLVVDSMGVPIPDVKIDYIAPAFERSTQATSEGYFEFDTRAPVVVFRKPLWKSQRVRVSSLIGESRIVMESAGEPTPLPICPKKAHCVTTGGIFCLPKTSGVGVGDIPYTIDTVERQFTIASWFGRWRSMTHGTGTAWGGPEPRDQEVWDSVEFFETQRDATGYFVLDSRGKTSDGKLWRSVGRDGESVLYVGQDQEDASLFDRMLDGLCVIPPK